MAQRPAAVFIELHVRAARSGTRAVLHVYLVVHSLLWYLRMYHAGGARRPARKAGFGVGSRLGLSLGGCLVFEYSQDGDRLYSW